MIRKILIGVLALLCLLLSALLIGYFNRPLPDAVFQQPLFAGITYTRQVLREPHPMIYHIVEIDLTAPGIRLLVTPGDVREDDYVYSARTTSGFLEDFGLQLAINGDFFDPWRDNGPWDTYPQPDDGVNTRGLSVSHGNIVTEGYVSSITYRTLYLTADNYASFDKPETPVYNAISGYLMILEDGKPVDWHDDDPYIENAHPRTAVALNREQDKLLLVIVDGRQPNYSDGASLHELAEIILRHGGYEALNLDGGGSAVLVIEDEAGKPILLNAPVHNRIPFRERPIANHLGIFASPLLKNNP